MTRKEMIAKMRRVLRDGRLWEARNLPGKSRGTVRHFTITNRFREAAAPAQTRPFGSTGIEAAAIFMETYQRLTRRD
jgi:hypothetical protein